MKNPFWRLAAAGLALACPAAALAEDPVIHLADRDVFPENLTITDDGSVIIGSVSQHYIYRAAPGADRAERWIDMTEFNSSSYGVLADDRSNTLFVCAMMNPTIGGRPSNPDQRRTLLRAFDLTTGEPEGAWPLPEGPNSCNDITVGPDGAAYVADTAGARIMRLAYGGEALETWFDGPQASGVDGIAFLGGDLYFTSLTDGGIYRVPFASGAPGGDPVKLTLSRELQRPDGMRAANGKLYIADHRLNEVVELTLDGDSAEVRLIKDGLDTAVGVAPRWDRVWIAELKSRYWREPELGSAEFTIQSASIAEPAAP